MGDLAQEMWDVAHHNFEACCRLDKRLGNNYSAYRYAEQRIAELEWEYASVVNQFHDALAHNTKLEADTLSLARECNLLADEKKELKEENIDLFCQLGSANEQITDLQARIAELTEELSQSMDDHTDTGRALRLAREENQRLRAQSLLRKVGEPLPEGCYCTPGKCAAPKPNWCRDFNKRDALLGGVE